MSHSLSNSRALVLALCTGVLLSQSSVARAKQGSVVITDESILQMVQDDVPSVARIRAALLAAEANYHSREEGFSTEAYSSINLERTRERPLIEFSPVFSPIHTSSIGVRRNFDIGASINAGVSLDQRSASSSLINISNGTTLVGSVSFSLDLWKDFLGKTSRSTLKNLEKAAERAKWEERINLHQFRINLRKLYWQLVANQESRRLNEALLKTAEVQLKDAKRRQANSIADSGEVARYESQVADREAQLVYLSYQRDLLVKDLQSLLPSLSNRKIELAKYDLGKTVREVLACTASISTHKNAPLGNTYYDEIIAAVNEQKKLQEKVNRTHGDIDLKLTTVVQTKGVDGGSAANGTIGGAFSDISQNNRLGYSVGLELTVPLGTSKGTSERLQVVRDQMRSDAEQSELKTRVDVAHSQLIRSMNYLTNVVRLQRKNSDFLKKRLKSLKKKYRQARIDVSTLVNDQNAQLQADLAIIDSQTLVLNALFEYLAIFTETPCDFNRS